MKWRVHFESSAAVGIEIEVEADSEEDAERKAESLFMSKSVADKIGNLIAIDEHALKGFADTLGLTIPYAVVSLDESGFEAVDTFEPDYIASGE